MKFYVAFLVLSIAATTLAGTCPICITTTTTAATTTVVPWGGCGSAGSGRTGLLGLLEQICNLLTNILTNVTAILTKCHETPAGVILLAKLNDLIAKISNILIIMLAGTLLTDDQCADYEAQLRELVAQINIILDILFGVGTGTSYCCNNAGGALGLLTNTIIKANDGKLNGECGHDCGLLVGVFNQMIAWCTGLDATLV